jgi:hypothetical protein
VLGHAAWIAACLLLLLVTGCTEMHKYWDRSPTAPEVPIDVVPPGLTIVFPPAGHRVAASGTLILSCTAVDPVEGPIPPGRISWQSSRDGPIGTGPYLRLSGLSAGTHTVTVWAVNASGARASAAVMVEVLAQPTYTFSSIYSGILQLRCVSCHYPAASDWPTHRLDLRTRVGLMAGGVTRQYESVVPCRPESSLVWNKLTTDPPWVPAPMPPAPNPKVPATLLDKLKVWILEGAPP